MFTTLYLSVHQNENDGTTFDKCHRCIPIDAVKISLSWDTCTSVVFLLPFPKAKIHSGKDIPITKPSLTHGITLLHLVFPLGIMELGVYPWSHSRWPEGFKTKCLILDAQLPECKSSHASRWSDLPGTWCPVFLPDLSARQLWSAFFLSRYLRAGCSCTVFGRTVLAWKLNNCKGKEKLRNFKLSSRGFSLCLLKMLQS